MKNRFNFYKTYSKYLAVLLIALVSTNAFAIKTVGITGGGCDYDNLFDAYLDADPILHITTQPTYFSASFTISKSKVFIGGFDNCDDAANGVAGNDKTVWRRFDDKTVITIDANQAANSIVIISNFEIFGGGDEDFAGTGGIKIRGNSSVIISNSDIHSNAGDLGGGISIFGSDASLDIITSEIRNNTAIRAGAGIYCESGSVVRILDQTAIRGNVSDGTGGGIHAISDCQITVKSGDLLSALQMQEGVFSNVAETFGGGIYAGSGTDIFITGDLSAPASVSFNASYAVTIAATGGGIYATGDGTSVTAVNARIDLNFTSQFGAGVVFEDSASFSMSRLDAPCWDNDKCSSLSENFTFSDNSGAAAGLFNNNATAQISGTYISKNNANASSVFSIGNAAYVRMEGNLLTGNKANSSPLSNQIISLYGAAATGANLDFFYNTVTSNASSTVFKLYGNDSQQTIKVSNSIINNAFNMITTTGAMSHIGSFDCLLVSEDQSLFGNIGFISTASPLFVDAFNKDFHLRANSPAIDFCDESFVQSLYNDLNGNQRGIDDLDTQNFVGTYDLGAYEYQSNDIIFKSGFE